MKWAGMLAHYLEDNTQPQHATIDYQSRAYFANKVRAPERPLRGRIQDGRRRQGRLHAAPRGVLAGSSSGPWTKCKDPVQTTDPWRATLEVSLASYDALPLIGEAAMEAAKQGGTPTEPQGAVPGVRHQRLLPPQRPIPRPRNDGHGNEGDPAGVGRSPGGTALADRMERGAPPQPATTPVPAVGQPPAAYARPECAGRPRGQALTGFSWRRKPRRVNTSRVSLGPW